ncbi:hypothetical protein Dimus_007658 [Dionaea muscipula]
MKIPHLSLLPYLAYRVLSPHLQGLYWSFTTFNIYYTTSPENMKSTKGAPFFFPCEDSIVQKKKKKKLAILNFLNSSLDSNTFPDPHQKNHSLRFFPYPMQDFFFSLSF